jgi:CheY-like chemotaxis protein
MKPRRTILVIDDEPDTLEATSLILELHLGPANLVIGGRDGVEGLARARATRPDLILCDCSMPRLDGRGFVEHARRDPALATIPILLYSGDPSLRALAAELRVAGYVSKSGAVSALTDEVDRLLGELPAPSSPVADATNGCSSHSGVGSKHSATVDRSERRDLSMPRCRHRRTRTVAAPCEHQLTTIVPFMSSCPSPQKTLQ